MERIIEIELKKEILINTETKKKQKLLQKIMIIIIH